MFQVLKMASVNCKDDARAKDTIPEVLSDPGTGKRYLRGRFLGKVKIQTCLFLYSFLSVFRVVFILYGRRYNSYTH